MCLPLLCNPHKTRHKTLSSLQGFRAVARSPGDDGNDAKLHGDDSRS